MSRFFASLLGWKLGLMLLCGAAVAGTAVFFAFPTASNEDYMPTQPIPYSHKIHAGQLKINCKYCHIGATQGQHALVPGLGICMNCHRFVKPASPYIQQIKKAYEEKRQIEWVRVHELPDHVRFNHRAHVIKGVQCETCHGNVAEMDVMYQFAPLTMGWCLGCHRGQTTPDYVRKLIYPDTGAAQGPVAPFNCSTCHY